LVKSAEWIKAEITLAKFSARSIILS
jgi:hypothetical protein